MPKHLTPPTPQGGMYLTDLEEALVRAIREWQHNGTRETKQEIYAAFYKAAPLDKVPSRRVRPRGRHARTTS